MSCHNFSTFWFCKFFRFLQEQLDWTTATMGLRLISYLIISYLITLCLTISHLFPAVLQKQGLDSMATKVGLGLKSIDISRRRVAISPIDFFTIFEFFFRISIFFLFLISKGVTELDVVDDGPKLGLMTSLEISPTLCYNISFCFWVHWIRWRGWDWSIQISRNTYFVLQHLIYFFWRDWIRWRR